MCLKMCIQFYIIAFDQRAAGKVNADISMDDAMGAAGKMHACVEGKGNFLIMKDVLPCLQQRVLFLLYNSMIIFLTIYQICRELQRALKVPLAFACT